VVGAVGRAHDTGVGCVLGVTNLTEWSSHERHNLAVLSLSIITCPVLPMLVPVAKLIRTPIVSESPIVLVLIWAKYHSRSRL